MSSLYGLLATQSAVHQIPAYVLIGCIISVLAAFTVGFVKGFRTVAWGGFYWLAASGAFVVAYKLLAKVNPIAAMCKGKLEGAASFAWAVVLMVICISVALIFYALYSAKFRPRRVKAPKSALEVDNYGFVYEDDREDDSPYQEEPTYVIVGGGKPNIFGRIAGGFMCAVNVAAVLMSVIAVVLIFIGNTALANGKLGAIFEVSYVKTALSYASAYVFDFFTIGIIIWVAYIGYNKGFIGSLRTVIIGLGILFIGDLCFMLPFTKAADSYFIAKLIERCAGLYTKLKPQYATLLAKATAGGILTGLGFVLLGVVAFLLKSAAKKIEKHMAAYIVDEILAVILYLIFGVALVASMWAFLYLLDYTGIFRISEAITRKASLSGEFFDVAEHYLKDFADNALSKLKLR